MKYGDRVLDESLGFWQECKDFEQPYKWGGKRGHETLRHFFANLSQEERNRAAEHFWDIQQATERQIKFLKWKFGENGYYLVREDFTMLEASMLIEWVKDFDNLDKKPMFELSYIMKKPTF